MDETYEHLLNADWQQAFSDSGTGDWRRQWFLDGLRATVVNTPEGMVFSAGPVAGDHASHGVLWTRRTFKGDVRIEWDYTRLDTINRYVNIVYVQATGSGEGPYAADIEEWRELRQIPFMASYFNTMNLLHVSYAAFGNSDDSPEDYVRARRYPTRPDRKFNQTDLPPDAFNTGLFQPGVTYHFCLMKTREQMILDVSNESVAKQFRWPLRNVEPVAEGRIGIRHMFTRCSRYRNIRICTR